MATDRFAYMYVDDIVREGHQAQRGVRRDHSGRDSTTRIINQSNRARVIEYRKILLILGYEGSVAEARRVFLDKDLRARIDQEWDAHQDRTSHDELIMSLDLMAERLAKRKE